MDLDTILPDVGEFGLYQQLLLWFVLLPGVLPCGFHAYNQLFMSARPDHWCRVPELDVLVDVSIEFIKNISIPVEQHGGTWRFSQCRMYERNYSALVEQFGTQPMASPVNRTTRCLHGWHYDYSEYATTVVTEWDLVCDKDIYTTLALVLLAIGGLFGNYVFGYLQDSIGRRPVFFIYLFIEFFFGIATAFAQDFWTWCFLRFGVGFTVPAILGTPYVLAIELVGPARRTACTLLTNVAYSVGLIILSAVVYFVRDWRQLALATSIPFLSFFLYWWVLPESPRWLLAQGRFEEAEKILKKMARINGKALPANYMVHLKRKYHVERYIQQKARKHQYGVLDLVRTPNLRCKTLMITFIWFTNTCVYVGLTYYAPVMGGDEFLNFFLAGAVELPVYVFLWPSMDCWGRRWVLCFSMVTGGAACLGTFFFENESRVKLGLFCVGKMGICSSFVVLPLMASELYPAVVRGIGMSTSSIIGMLGPVFVPFVVHMGEERSSIPLTAMGSLMVVSGVLSLLLPETLHQHLPQTLEDGEMFGKTWSWRQWITCCPPRDSLKKEDKSTSKESPIRSLIQHHIRDPKPVTVVEGTTPDFTTASIATTTTDTISEATTAEHTLKITVV